MNAPLVAASLMPSLAERAIAPAFLEQLQARFGAQCSTAMAVREQHGRDESAMQAPPPVAVVFAQSTEDVAAAVQLAAQYRAPVIPFGVGS
ncbi:MAG: FAD-binding oxidoreductase, partial [Rhodoferax sp.]|nr:FAD-binding oxidoreductase [Rhodoferax sp.]